MWMILFTEYNYNKNLILMFVCFIPLIFAVDLSLYEGSAPSLIGLIGFLIIHTMATRIGTENRGILYSRLPVTPLQRSLIRVLIIVLPFLFVLSIFCFVYYTTGHLRSELVKITLLFSTVYILFYAFFIVLQDMFTIFNVKLNVAKSPLVMFVTATLLLVAGTFFFYLFALFARKSDQNPWYFEIFKRFLESLFTSNGLIIILILIFGLLTLSIYTYSRRKSYLTYMGYGSKRS